MEPWNALTSLVMMVPALIWFFRLRKEWKRYRFLLWCIPWLVLGSLGSALFHAFRSSQVFLLMDVLPMAVLTLSVSIYFWVQVLPSWWMVFLVLVPSFLLRFWMFEFLPMQAAINLSYLLTGVLIFLPLLIILVRTRFLAWTDLLLSAASLSLALLFRKMDSWNIPQLPMGTHFLWHLLSAPGAWFLAKYLYRYRNRAEDA